MIKNGSNITISNENYNVYNSLKKQRIHLQTVTTDKKSVFFLYLVRHRGCCISWSTKLNKTANEEAYCYQLEAVDKNLQKKKRKSLVNCKRSLFLYDNAKPHIARFPHEKITRLKLEFFLSSLRFWFCSIRLSSFHMIVFSVLILTRLKLVVCISLQQNVKNATPGV